MATISKEQALDLLPLLKAELDDSMATRAKDYNLIKYLRWKPDIQRAANRYKGLQQWRQENSYAFDDPILQASKDATLKRVLQSNVLVAPEGMVDKQGHAVIVGRLRNNDMSDGRTPQDVVRMFIYTIDRVLEREEAQQNGVVVFHDMNGLVRSNLHPAIPNMLLKALISHFPTRIKGIYILNAPWFFKGLFSVISLLMPSKLRERAHFVNDIKDIYKVIEKDEMLQEHGGKRLHDSVEWVAAQIKREEDGSMQSLRDCNPA